MNSLKLVRCDKPDDPLWSLNTGTWVIGRKAGCDIRIDNPAISRRHAQLEVLIDGAVRVKDLNSKNGTRINKKPVQAGGTLLQAGDRLNLGDVCLALVSEDVPVPCIPDSEMTVSDKPSSYVSINALPYDKLLEEWRVRDDAMGKAYRALFEMIGMLVAEQPLDNMVDETLERLQQTVEAHRYAVFLGQGDKDSLKLFAQRSTHQGTDSHFEISRTILKQALKERKALSLSDLPADRRFAGRDSVMLMGVHSAMVVPLIEQDRVVGVLYVDSKSPVHRYDENALSIAVAFGHLLAAKIVQHQLFQERQEREALESELRVASDIQRGLMPDTVPDVPGYVFHAYQEQTRMVGGDLYDVAVRRDGRAYFLQADVAGKGVGAALMAANILSAFRILNDAEVFPVEQAVERVSRHMFASTPDVQFATVFLALLDPSRHRVEYVNAGHHPPMLVHRDGTLEYLSSGHLPVGVLEDYHWRAKSVPLARGDRLLIFTDGVPDAENEEQAQYGMKRLEAYARAHASLPPKEFVSGLLEDLDHFMGDAPQADDLTLLLVARDDA